MAEKDNLIIGIVLIIIVALLIRNSKLQVSDSSLSSIPSKAIFNTQGISKNIFAVAGSCRPEDDGELCCEDPGYVLCGDTNTCGPDEAWCSNFLNPDVSCNIDKSRCCNDAGWVYDYPTGQCCSPQNPYYYSGNLCGIVPSDISDNYYTRLSECKPGGASGVRTEVKPGLFMYLPEKCEGNSYSVCVVVQDNIYLYSNQGITVGKCGIECFSGETKCDGVNKFVCENNKYIDKGVNIGECGVECIPERNVNLFSTQGLSNSCPNQLDYDCTLNKCVTKQESTYYRLENNQCNQINLLPSEKTLIDYDILSECQNEIQCITNWQCSSWSNCLNGKQERVCTDANSCGVIDGKPIESQSCSTGISGGDSTICMSDIEKQCYDNDIYYYDSCGIRGSKYQECENGCLNAQCKTKTFFEKYGGASFILLIVLSLGIWLLLRSKK